MKTQMLLFFLVFLTGCAPSTVSEYRTEGEGHIIKLIEELSQIETASQLETKQGRLKKRFALLVDLMIEAKKFQIKRSGDSDEVTTWQLKLSDRLKRELIRIYEIEGCAEIIEEIERSGIHRLDLFERRQGN